MLSPHDPLLDAIAANPDDVAPWTVYGDLLQTQSDPRGELIALMIEREQRPTPRLYEMQRELIARNARNLAPSGFATDAARLVWRRGFVSELRLTSPDELVKVIAEPKLRFVDAATLVIDDWEDWCEELAGRQLPWRRLHVEFESCPETLELAPLFACFPAIELLRIKCPQDEAPPIVWEGVDARRLELLVLVDCGEIDSLDEAELPSLRELRLLRQTSASEQLRGSLRWTRLETVVLSDEDANPDTDTTAVVRVTTPIERDVDEESNAFVVIGGHVDLALVEKVVGRISLIYRLSARIAPLAWSSVPATVIQLYGTAQAELPYDLAIALQQVITPAPPIALIEHDETRGRFLVLGKSPVRDEMAPPSEAARRALDLALGRDPGFAILDDIEDELLSAPVHILVGDGRVATILNVIDPTNAPLIEPEPEEDEGDYDDDYDDDDREEYEAYYEIPGEYANEDAVPVFVQLAAELDEYDEPEDFVDEPYHEPSEHDALDCPELWFDFRNHWDDRAVDADDEPDAERWVDPEQLSERDLDLERHVAVATCAGHEIELEQCSWCGAPLCVACEREEGHKACLAALSVPARLAEQRATVS